MKCKTTTKLMYNNVRFLIYKRWAVARPKIHSSDDFNIYKLPSLNDNDRPFVFELDEEDKAYLGSFSGYT